MAKILIVDDDVDIGNIIQEIITRDKHEVLRAYSGTEAQLLLKNNRPDLILLDLMLPGLSGAQLLQDIYNIPVIVVSANANIDSKVTLLLGGAVDYITKPFDSNELLARIAVQLRKACTVNESILKHGDLILDTATHVLKLGTAQIRLTRTEFAIIKLLMINGTTIVTKSQILDLLSADTPDGTESSLKIHISNLRKKLRAVDNNDYIEAVWGIGFKLKNLN